MTQTQDKTLIRGQPPQEQSSDHQYQPYHFEQGDGDTNLDLQEQYISKLTIQRKRIQVLSRLHLNNEDKIQKQIQKNRLLTEEIQRLSSAKDYQNRYHQTIVNLQTVTQDNKVLRQQIQDLKQQLYQSSAQKGNLIQKLRTELSLLRDKEASKIETLQDEISNKQEEIQKITRENRGRQKELQDTISSFKSKISNLESQHQQNIKTEQRKLQRLEKELQTKNYSYNEAQLNTDSLLKENIQLKEENYRLNTLLNNKDIELASQTQKLKNKINSIKKQLKNKEKECIDYRQSHRKLQKQSQDYTTQTQSLRIQIRRVKQTLETERGRMETDFTKERQSLQAIINQHVRTIEQLIGIKNDLQEENRRMQSILKKKEAVEKHRRLLLKTQLKQIDKLQKVIDKIVD